MFKWGISVLYRSEVLLPGRCTISWSILTANIVLISLTVDISLLRLDKIGGSLYPRTIKLFLQLNNWFYEEKMYYNPASSPNVWLNFMLTIQTSQRASFAKSQLQKLGLLTPNRFNVQMRHICPVVVWAAFAGTLHNFMKHTQWQQRFALLLWFLNKIIMKSQEEEESKTPDCSKITQLKPRIRLTHLYAISNPISWCLPAAIKQRPEWRS